AAGFGGPPSPQLPKEIFWLLGKQTCLFMNVVSFCPLQKFEFVSLSPHIFAFCPQRTSFYASVSVFTPTTHQLHRIGIQDKRSCLCKTVSNPEIGADISLLMDAAFTWLCNKAARRPDGTSPDGRHWCIGLVCGRVWRIRSNRAGGQSSSRSRRRHRSRPWRRLPALPPESSFLSQQKQGASALPLTKHTAQIA